MFVQGVPRHSVSFKLLTNPPPRAAPLTLVICQNNPQPVAGVLIFVASFPNVAEAAGKHEPFPPPAETSFFEDHSSSGGSSLVKDS